MVKLSDDIKKEILRLYVEEKASLVRVNRETKVSVYSIKTVLKENNIVIRLSGEYGYLGNLNKPRKSEEEIRKRKRDYYVKWRGPLKERALLRSYEIEEEIIRLYVIEKLSAAKVAAIVNLPDYTISKFLTIKGVKRSRINLNNESREKTEKWSGESEIINKYWRQITKNAKKRNFEFNISKLDAIEILHAQQYKCALSGVDICLPRDNMEYHGKYTASLDRIDSSRGYTKENCQWLHKRINVMKLADNDVEFYNWCKLIYFNSKDRFKELNGEL